MVEGGIEPPASSLSRRAPRHSPARENVKPIFVEPFGSRRLQNHCSSRLGLFSSHHPGPHQSAFALLLLASCTRGQPQLSKRSPRLRANSPNQAAPAAFICGFPHSFFKIVVVINKLPTSHPQALSNDLHLIFATAGCCPNAFGCGRRTSAFVRTSQTHPNSRFGLHALSSIFDKDFCQLTFEAYTSTVSRWTFWPSR